MNAGVRVGGRASAGCDVGAGERGGMWRHAGILRLRGAGVRAMEVGAWGGGVNKNTPKKHEAIFFGFPFVEGVKEGM